MWGGERLTPLPLRPTSCRHRLPRHPHKLTGESMTSVMTVASTMHECLRELSTCPERVHSPDCFALHQRRTHSSRSQRTARSDEPQ